MDLTNMPVILKGLNFCFIVGFGVVETADMLIKAKKDKNINVKTSLAFIGSKYVTLGVVNGNFQKIFNFISLPLIP